MSEIHELTPAYGIEEEWVVPPGCTPRANSYGVFHHTRRYDLVDNDAEHRVKPDDLVSNQTSQPKQYTHSFTAGPAYYFEVFECPHGGIHGVTYFKRHVLDIGLHSPAGIYFAPEPTQWAWGLRQKIDEVKINLGSSLAEYRASARMFGGFATGAYKAFQTIRGRMPRNKLRACSIPAAHLAYSYGIRPLVSDLYDSVEELNLRLGLPVHKRVTSFTNQRWSGTEELVGRDWKYNSVRSQRVIAYLQFDPSFLGAFSMGNPIEWSWELIPFSFVVDSVIPVGQWLAQLDALVGVSNIKGTVTTKERHSHSGLYTAPNHVNLGPSVAACYSHERVGFTSVPFAPLPKWSPSKSYKTIINHLSLLLGISSTCRNRR
jgi:hypothetical protein